MDRFFSERYQTQTSTGIMSISKNIFNFNFERRCKNSLIRISEFRNKKSFWEQNKMFVLSYNKISKINPRIKPNHKRKTSWYSSFDDAW